MIKKHQEQLVQLLTATTDARVKDTAARDYLVQCGYAQRKFGWNVVTPWGASVAANLGLTK